MKATELMVGNWVLINGTPRKIQAVDGVDDEIMANDELYTLAEDRYHSEDKVEGVPITPEILEKNGFLKQAGEIWEFDIFLEDKKFVSMIVWRRDYVTPNLSVRSFTLQYGSYSRRNVNYVHELQNALRLCGIEKEIEL